MTIVATAVIGIRAKINNTLPRGKWLPLVEENSSQMPRKNASKTVAR